MYNFKYIGTSPRNETSAKRNASTTKLIKKLSKNELDITISCNYVKTAKNELANSSLISMSYVIRPCLRSYTGKKHCKKQKQKKHLLSLTLE